MDISGGMIHKLNLWYRFRIAIFLLCAAGVLALSMYFYAFSAGRPYMGIIISQSGHGWVVESVDPNGAAVQAGIKPGDIPSEINGQAADTFLYRYEKPGVVFGQSVHSLTVNTPSGLPRSVSLLEAMQSAAAMTELAAFIVVSVVLWATGFFVIVKRPRNPAARVMCLWALSVGLAFSGQMAALRAMRAAVYIEVAASLLAPWLLLHFFLILPDERVKLRQSRLVYLIYLPAAITLVVFPIIGIFEGQPEPQFRVLRLLEYSVGYLAAAIVIVYNYLRALNARTRQQMQVILISSLAALVPVLAFSVLPSAIWRQTLLPAGLNIVFVGFIPLGMGYAIVTKRLMDIDVVIRRWLVYGLVTLVMATIMSAAIFAVTAFNERVNTPQRILIALGLGIVAAVLFGPSKRGIEVLLDRFFYKDRYDYRQIIQSLSNSLKTLRDFPEISRLIVATITEALNLGGACLFVKGKSTVFEISAAQGIFTDSKRQTELVSQLAPSRRHSLAEFPNSATSVSPDLAFIIPLVAGEREVGLLCLSQKVSRQDFSSNDLYLLQGISSVAAIGLRSASLMRDVSMRDSFVSIASHELNTPLTSVVGYADLLLKRDLPATERRWVKQIFDAGARLTAIVEDLLDITRIQAGRVVLKLDEVKLEEIFAERLAMARETSSAHEFIIDIAPDTPEVLVDRDKFGQVLWNLVSNAIKYSPKGGRITIAARYEPGEHSVVVSVADQGMGIGGADRDSLFTTFHRIQRPETAGIKGAGLGLYIVKQWTEAMGGNVWLESELDKGSIFFIAVPAIEPTARNAL
jgi:signal transduction histidine kinase